MTFLLLAATPALADDKTSFRQWLADFKQEAAGKGISEATLNQAFARVEPLPEIIALDRRQPESTMTMEQYLAKVVSDQRIENGRAKLAEHRALLDEIGGKYGVPPRYIVALWGVETSYGENTGNYGVVESLATLAYDGRRSAFFRGELLNALTIIDQDHIAAESMYGSWAGAMGQCQFMPSSFLNFAVDHDGDGRRDIWFSNGDVFASIANYLESSGWDADAKNNDKVLLKWNRSSYFVAAVNLLADEIGGSDARLTHDE